MRNWLKYTLSTAVAMLAASLLATSCEKVESPLFEEELVEVTFNPTIDQEATRAGEANHINVLYIEVYLNGSKVGTLIDKVVTGGVIESFSMNLIKGQHYDFIFWAQDKDCGAYSFGNPKSLRTITVNYPNPNTDTNTPTSPADVSNRDVFYKHIYFTVNSSNNVMDVDLCRPFAYVVAGTNVENFSEGVTTKMTFANIATTFDAFNGTTSNPTEVSINFTPSRSSSNTYNGHILYGAAYVLPTNNQTTITIESTKDSNTKTTTISLDKLEANKRYNILGNL